MIALALAVSAVHVTSDVSALTYYDLLLSLGLPVLALLALVAPKSVRTLYRADAAEHPDAAGPANAAGPAYAPESAGHVPAPNQLPSVRSDHVC